MNNEQQLQVNQQQLQVNQQQINTNEVNSALVTETQEVSDKPKIEKRTMVHMMPYLVSAYIGEKSFAEVAQETGKKDIEVEQLLASNFHRTSRKLRDLKNHAEFTVEQMSSETTDTTEMQYQLMTAKRGLSKIISELNQFAFVK